VETTQQSRARLIGIDASTSAVKAVAFDANGSELAKSRVPIATMHPFPDQDEQDPTEWASALDSALEKLARQLDLSAVAAIALTHQRETFVLVDPRNDALCNAVVWSDRRAAAEVQTFGSAELHQKSGKPADLTPSFYKLLWFKANRPTLLARAHKMLDVGGYLLHHLTGRYVTSWASADGSGLINPLTSDWHPELVELAGLRFDQLAELVPPGTVVGSVDTARARRLGLPDGVAIVATAGDGQCASLGTGMKAEDEMYLNVGTAIVAGRSGSIFTTDRGFRTLCDVRPGTYLYETLQNSGTYMISWFLKEFGQSTEATNEASPEEILSRQAEAVGPGANGLICVPYWNAAQSPYWDPSARGITIGWTGTHTKAHFYRAILEGIAFELRLAIESMQAATGVVTRTLVATGGGMQSALWRSIFADITGCRLVTIDKEITALGAAILGAAAIGLHGNKRIDDALGAMTQRGPEKTEPSATSMKAYENLYHSYIRVYPALRMLTAG